MEEHGEHVGERFKLFEEHAKQCNEGGKKWFMNDDGLVMSMRRMRDSRAAQDVE